jgi:Protein of unknown function DUF58
VAEETDYRIRLLSWLPLVKVHWTWEQPAGVQVRIVSRWGSLREEVTAEQRAERPNVVRLFVVSDLLGLARFSFRKRQNRELTIAPHRGNLQDLQLVPQHDAGDAQGHPQGPPQGDLLEMRAYAPGDPLKNVLWKVFARTGQLLVRMPERAVQPCERTLAYLVAGPGDEPAAGIARKVLETGMLGRDFLFGADGEDAPTSSVDEAVRQIVRSANAWRYGAVGLEKFLALGAAEGIQACTLFVPARPGSWLNRVAVLLARHPGPFRVLVGVDGLQTGAKRTWLGKLLLWQERSTANQPEEVLQVIEPLQHAGAQVIVVDRTAGKILPQVQPNQPRSSVQAIGA